MKYLNLLNKSLSINKFKLSDLQIEKIDQFIALLLKWNKTINLTAHRTPEEIIEKDICDVLYLNKAIEDYCRGEALPLPERSTGRLTDPSLWGSPLQIIDLGCGAGFNGLILALLKPENTITFLDSDRKKMNFVKQACRELELKNADFILGRVASLPRGQGPVKQQSCAGQFSFDLTVTRATWNVIEYLGYAANYVHNNGHAIFMAGKEEIDNRSEVIDNIGFLGTSAYEYTILPQKYQRKIFFYKKRVSRETL